MTSIKFQSNVNSLLGHRYEELLHSEKYYDCLFHICGAEVRCHKLILAAASPVFEAMFYGPLQEQQPLEIEILDISADIFKILINYIYTGMVNYASLTLAQTIELQYSAEKYLLDELNAESLQAAANKLRFTNILPALELSVRMHLDKLMEICLKFFQHCCLTADAQFSNFLRQTNYVHISKDCLKALLTSLPTEQQHQLLWFILLWCQHECEEYGLQQSEIPLLLHDLQLKANVSSFHGRAQSPQFANAHKRQRLYFKASRPFYVDGDSRFWKLQLKCNRFIRLLGISMYSRLKPQAVQIVGIGCHSASLSMLHLPDDYKEEVSIEIRSITGNDNGGDELPALIWEHKFVQRAIKYNCDVNINWDDTGVVLSPDLTYELILKWSESAFGAEYPCSLLSNEIDGIRFHENNAHGASLIKGFRYSDLI